MECPRATRRGCREFGSGGCAGRPWKVRCGWDSMVGLREGQVLATIR